MVDAVQTWRYAVDVRQYGFFLAQRKRPGSSRNGHEGDSKLEDRDRRPATPGTPSDDLGYEWVVGSLGSFENGFFEGTEAEDRFVCFADPSTYDLYPGWMLRNLLVLIGRKWKLEKVQILCYRDIQARRHEAHSMILQLEQRGSSVAGTDETPNLLTTTEMPKVTGWERNSAGKVMSKIANLGDYMDPHRLVIPMSPRFED